ncbi:MAG: hypothetical protein ACE37H_08650 [Phycisphaeraceae bacterium]
MPTRTICLLFAFAAVPATDCLADQPEPAPAPPQQVERPVAAIDPLTRQEPDEADSETETEDDNAEGEGDKLTEEELRKQMAELEKKLKETRDQFQQRAQQERQKEEEKKRKLVEQIELPENPTREQCEAFVAELREAASGRRSFSSGDPIVDKLKSLPEDHYDLLMIEMSNRTSLRYFANYAMRGIDPEKLRRRFIETLKDNPNNIGIIVMNGWTLDVKDEIIAQVQNADANLSPAWFQAAVEIAEPKLYPKLHEITVGSRYASQFLTILQALPDYDLEHTVNVCWQRAVDDKIPVSESSFALLATEVGNVEALGSLIDQLRSSSSYYTSSSTYNIRRTNVFRFIDYRGSNEEVRAWYEANKDKLVFDHLRKRFYLEDGP